ncbi:hypothetical protein P691DRAFT_811368 [Macrolepiota fuliginosa MF-IS2]|uniref:Receptor-activated Ca2+-permeable cation channel n=1 Tax=Macrolepiota fuliginosa MF-IS2 TaxID=1400762 RepID=A0A9P6BY36_9AGAR|nr:hypothetical protein P691DRAFT_811368 [Macrolepiota fuliginosa MF-IS2]
MDPEQASLAALLAPTPENLASVKVFPLIPALKKDVTKTIDSALSWDQLTASDINFAIVRPLVSKYARLRNMAVVYACLVVRSYFLAQSETDLAFAGVMLSRASLCEILAMKLLSHFASNYIQLIAVLTTAWNPLAGATREVVQEVKHAIHSKHDLETAQTAIEMAISTKAKAFLASTVTQKVVNDIYSGNVVFSIYATRSILADNYKPRAIQIYDVRNAPFLNHYRLRVPRYKTILEFLNFTVLMLTFVLCLANKDKAQLTFWEVAFIVIGSAFALEEYTASTENGWYLYIANMWNAFDFTFIAIFLIYLGLRIQGLHNADLNASSMAFDVLACGACILFPRLVFFAVSNHVFILSLRAMIVQFVFFVGIAAICFSGMLFTLWTLAQDQIPLPDQKPWTVRSIAWLIVQIWFGNTYLSFNQASSFHPVFGPILMTIFAALSNTLLLTILISILSNTVARIDANATQEYLFQFAISTIEGVKSDALFSYQPPFNILAFLILKPASWFLSPRALHSANVFLIKVTSLPQLIAITVYEKHLASGQKFRQTSQGAAQSLFQSLPRHIKNMPLVEALVGSSNNDLYDAIFDMNINDDDIDIFAEFDDEDERPILKSVHSRENVSTSGNGTTDSIWGPSSSNPATPRRRTPRAKSATRLTINPNYSPKGSPRNRVQSALPSMTPATAAEQKLTGEGYGAVATGSALLSRPDDFRFPTGMGDEYGYGNGNSEMKSPLERFYSQRSRVGSAVGGPMALMTSAEANASVRRIETLLGEVKELPVRALKEEMKELQERQARIENLLLTLTRGMRNELHRHDTI